MNDISPELLRMLDQARDLSGVPPVAVNLGDPDTLPATIRPVGENK